MFQYAFTLKTSVPMAVAVAWLVVVFEAPAHAYLDPGTGSMLLQVLLGGFAAVGVIAKLYWHRLASLFGSKNAGPPPTE